MNPLPDGIRGRFLAIMIAALIPLSIYFLLVSPLLAYYDNTEQRLLERLNLAHRYAALTGELPVLRTGEKNWKALAGGEWLLPGSSDAVASAALQSQVKGLVENGGGRLASTEVLAAEQEGNFRRVGVRIEFSGDIKFVASVLRGIEISRPILATGDFDIHAVDNGSDGEPRGNLAIVLDVYGFRAA